MPLFDVPATSCAPLSVQHGPLMALRVRWHLWARNDHHLFFLILIFLLLFFLPKQADSFLLFLVFFFLHLCGTCTPAS